VWKSTVVSVTNRLRKQTEWLVAKKRKILSVKNKINVIKEIESVKKKADVYFK
jgi:hypothetical protein